MNLPAGLATATAAGTSASAGAAATTTAERPASAACSAAEAAFRFRTRFIDVQGTAIHAIAVQGSNCVVCLTFVFHFYESESTGTSGVAISHDSGTGNSAVPFEQCADGIIGGAVREIAHENVLHSIPPKRLQSGPIGEHTEMDGSGRRPYRTLSAGFAEAIQTRSKYTTGLSRRIGKLTFKWWRK
jgi:hypothetical protein